jgi:hypothetical protein
VWFVPRLCKFYFGICLTTEEKAWKNLSQGKENLSQVKKNLSQSTVYILPKTPTHYKALTKKNTLQNPLTNPLQNNKKPQKNKLKRQKKNFKYQKKIKK